MDAQIQDRRSSLVVYGSETGNAHDLAEELGETVYRLGFAASVSCLDAINPLDLSTFSIVIISIATTGQGEFPSNARVFWKKLLRKKLPPSYLKSVKYTIFGLGDSSYPKFNWAARKLRKRLSQLGAIEHYPIGEADEQHPAGPDASFLPWSAGLRQNLLETFSLSERTGPVPDHVLLPPRWTLSLVEPLRNGTGNSEEYIPEEDAVLGSKAENSELLNNGVSSQDDSKVLFGSLTVAVQKNERLTPRDHWQDVRHLVLTSDKLVDFAPGDVLTIYPKNLPKDVDIVIALMNWEDIADRPVHFRPGWSSHGDCPSLIPTFRAAAQRSMTFRTLLTNHLDLMAIPRRSFFSTVARFTEDQMQKERLLEFSNPDYVDELYDYTSRPRRSVLEVLQDFDSIKIPWQWITSVLPELRGRQFSIANGGQLKHGDSNGTRFELLVAIVKYRTVLKKIREGICTRYLASLPPGTQMQVKMQKGSLGVNKMQVGRPVVMIGAGTGVAPLRSLIWERFSWHMSSATANLIDMKNAVADHHNSGQSVLFFGCRKKEADFFFNDDWATLRNLMPLRVFTAFSRDQTPKIYVQDVIEQQAELVYQLLYESKGIVYVCGSSGSMPKSVRTALVSVFRRVGRIDQEVAENYLQTMERDGRYLQETW